jgi:hypothetical protein
MYFKRKASGSLVSWLLVHEEQNSADSNAEISVNYAPQLEIYIYNNRAISFLQSLVTSKSCMNIIVLVTIVPRLQCEYSRILHGATD